MVLRVRRGFYWRGWCWLSDGNGMFRGMMATMVTNGLYMG